MNRKNVMAKMICRAMLAFCVSVCLAFPTALRADIFADSLLIAKYDFKLKPTEPLSFTLPGDGVGYVKMRGAADVSGMRNGSDAESGWGYKWYAEGDSLLLSIQIGGGSDFPDDPFDEQRYITVVAKDGKGQQLLKRNIYDGMDSYGKNCMLSVTAFADHVDIEAGQYKAVGVAQLNVGVLNAVRVEMWTTRPCKARGIVVYSHADERRSVDMGWDGQSIGEALNAAQLHPIEGNWHFFDRDTNPAKAEPGGTYHFAVVRHKPDKEVSCRPIGVSSDMVMPDFDVVYLSGATTNKQSWEPYMVKAFLYATPFEGRYRMVWYDSLFEPINREVYAELVTADLLSFDFPLFNSQLRFSK